MGLTDSGWSRETWGWSPAQGRWSARRHGSPKGVVHVRLNTDDLRPHERYDFWRETALYDVDADSRHGAPSFRAEAAGIIGPEGAVYVNRADALSGTRRHGESERDGCDNIAIGLVTAGRREHEEGEERGLATAGQYLVYDAGRASRLTWSSYATVHLTLERRSVETFLGTAVPSSANLARRLQATAAGRILATHLKALSGEMEYIEPHERAGVLGITLDLAYLALRAATSDALHERDLDSHAAIGDGVFAAALRLIDANLANPDLGPAMLAALLGCSRATLYRGFAERDAAIAEVIRARRLARARALLAHAPRSVSIAEIAMRCGYPDPGHFSRAFRREFGISPSDVRG